MSVMGKPYIKWAGGKTKILPEIVSHFPKEGDTFHDIFLGGGSVLIHMLQNTEDYKYTRYVGYDINPVLIHTYQMIKTNHIKLGEKLQILHNNILKLPIKKEGVLNRKPKDIGEAKLCRENYYFYIRNRYNSLKENSLLRSALFIFLNKAGFRGLYREGPNGFNVPYGNYKNPCIYDKKNIEVLHRLFQNAEFKCLDYKDSIKEVKDGDFMYLDPPYVPLNVKSFVKYNKNGFNEEMYMRLFDLIKTKGNFIMSNSNAEQVIKEFNGYYQKEIIARRAINSKNPEEKQKELLIMPDRYRININ